MDRVWKNSREGGGKLLLLLAIADFADDDGMAFPGIDTLAEKTRQSRRTVQRQLRELEEEQEIAIEPGTGRSNTHTYWVLTGLDENIKQERIEAVQKLKGDILSSIKKGDKPDEKRASSDPQKPERATSTTLKGDIAMTPEPLLTKKRKRLINNTPSSSLRIDLPKDLIEELLRFGVYQRKLPQIAASGWTPAQIRREISDLMEDARPQRDRAALLVHRICNEKPPASPEDLRINAYKKWLPE